MQEPQETWVPSLGREDPLEEEMATHSSFLAWRIPWTAEPGGLQSMGSQRVGHEWATEHTFLAWGTVGYLGAGFISALIFAAFITVPSVYPRELAFIDSWKQQNDLPQSARSRPGGEKWSFVRSSYLQGQGSPGPSGPRPEDASSPKERDWLLREPFGRAPRLPERSRKWGHERPPASVRQDTSFHLPAAPLCPAEGQGLRPSWPKLEMQTWQLEDGSAVCERKHFCLETRVHAQGLITGCWAVGGMCCVSWKTRRGLFLFYFFPASEHAPGQRAARGRNALHFNPTGADPSSPATQKDCHPLSSAAQPAWRGSSQRPLEEGAWEAWEAGQPRKDPVYRGFWLTRTDPRLGSCGHCLRESPRWITPQTRVSQPRTVSGYEGETRKIGRLRRMGRGGGWGQGAWERPEGEL